MKSLLLLSLPLFLVSVPAASGANLLVNGGFEVGLDAPPGQWVSFQGGDAISTVSGAMPRTGSGSLDLMTVNANEFAGTFQDVDGLIAGQEVTYSGWHKLSGANGGTEIRIEWRDSGSDTEITRTGNLTPVVGSTYELFTLTDTVPVGADTARVVYAIQSFGAPPNQQVFVDDVEFHAAPIPEPGRAVLLGCGAVACMLRRRRK